MLEQHLTEFQVQEFADGKLSSADSRQIEKHLLFCRKCQRQVDFYKQMYQTLAKEKEYALPADFAKNIAGKVISESSHSPWLERILWALGIVAGLITSFYWFDFDKMHSHLNNIATETVQAFQTLQFEWFPNKNVLFLMFFSAMLIKVLDHVFAILFSELLRKK